MSEHTPEVDPNEATGSPSDQAPVEVDPPALDLERPEYDIIEKSRDHGDIETPEDGLTAPEER